MRFERRDGGDERRILIGMITDPVVCAAVASVWDPDNPPLSSKWSNLIGGWCVKYHSRYSGCPGKKIEQIFESWSSKGNRDSDTVDHVHRFLAGLSLEYEQDADKANSQFLLDLARDHFDTVRLRKLADALLGDIEAGDLKTARERFANSTTVELSGHSYVDVLNDEAAYQDAFERKADVLIRYPGALGEFFGDSLERDGFIAIQAPEKRGKSFTLIDIACTGVEQRRRTAFFAVGDMSKPQMLRRLGVRFAGKPLKPKTLMIPDEIIHEDHEQEAQVEAHREVFDEPLNWRDTVKNLRILQDEKIRSSADLFRMSVHPNTSINVTGIESILKAWSRNGWMPDVVVIDYADILAPMGSGGWTETRHQIDATWRALRRLSQELHCLVVTATQSDAASYDAALMTKQHFAECKSKYAHVTGTFGLNQTDDEKDQGIYRYNWLVLREDGFSATRPVYVAGCLDICRPNMVSTW